MEQLLKDIRDAYGAQKAKMVGDVLSVVEAKVRAKNLFGWRSYITDLKIDLAAYMIESEFKWSGGGYVMCGMQSALDKSRYCSAKKRRGDYETVSLDKFFQVADETLEEESNIQKANRIIDDVRCKFGDKFAMELKPFLLGLENKLSKAVVEKLRSPEYKEWFVDYLGGVM